MLAGLFSLVYPRDKCGLAATVRGGPISGGGGGLRVLATIGDQMLRHLSFALAACLAANTAASDVSAVRDALAHAIRLHPAQAKLTRYVWCPVGSKPAIDLGLAFAMADDVPRVPTTTRVSDDLLAVDFRYYANDPARLLEQWDALAKIDPVFHVDGKLAPHIDDGNPRADVTLAKLTASAAPILEARFLLEQALDVRYYDFRGIEVGKPSSHVFARRGYFFGEARKTNGLKANYLNRSGVTGDPRVVVALFGTSNRSPATVTYDSDDDRDADKALIRNLATFDKVEDGREAFLPLPCGLLEFVLTDGEGVVVSEAPPTLAVDTSKPPGHDTTLRPALSCISCHSRAGEGFYRKLADGFGRLPRGYFSQADKNAILSLYGEALEREDGVLGRLRRDLADAAQPAIGDASIDSVCQEITSLIHGYRYALLDTEAMSDDLGFDVRAVPLEPGYKIDPEIFRAIRGDALSRDAFDAVRPTMAALYWEHRRRDAIRDSYRADLERFDRE